MTQTIISQTIEQLDKEFMKNGWSYLAEEKKFELKGFLHRYCVEKGIK